MYFNSILECLGKINHVNIYKNVYNTFVYARACDLNVQKIYSV